MEQLIQELASKVWGNPRFHSTFEQIELAWLQSGLGFQQSSPVSYEIGCRAMEAAAILACSDEQEQRRAAFRLATYVYELLDSEETSFGQALRVVLSRLGNFPSIATRSGVNSSFEALPWKFAAEEIQAKEEVTVQIGEGRVTLTPFQFDLWEKLSQQARVAISAPTSAGKSYVLQRYLSSVFQTAKAKVIVYIVPTRALITQVARDLDEQLQELGGSSIPPVLTMPVDEEAELPQRAIYVFTQERTQLALSSSPDFRADTVIVDEAHSIEDGARGVLLQWVVDDLLKRSPDAQIMFASPIVRNLDVFGRIFGIPDVVKFSSVEPTVAQNFVAVEVESATKGRITLRTAGDGSRAFSPVGQLTIGQTLASRIDKLVHISAVLGQSQSNIIYANGAAEAEDIALQLADVFKDRVPSPTRLALAELAADSVHDRYVLAHCVARGIGFHYSNIPTNLRQAIEDAFSAGELDYLVCTSTLLQGVNLPAKNIFMCAPEKGRLKPLESTDFWNLAGRAGRLRREFQGNIFLIDYTKWKKQPLSGPKDCEIVPAIEDHLRTKEDQLTDIIRDKNFLVDRRDHPDLEGTFVRLLTDLQTGNLNVTLERSGLPMDSSQAIAITQALEAAHSKLTLPPEILRNSPNISAHKQQRLYDHLQAAIENGGPQAAKQLVPLHPRDPDAFESLAQILELGHKFILGIDTKRGLHRFHALLAWRWMCGFPLPRIVEAQIARSGSKSVRTAIRDTLSLIENEIRFKTVRLVGCYSSLLAYALNQRGLSELASSMPAVPLYLEVGASDRTMISLISLGLSRVAAMRLNELSANKNLDVEGAQRWLAHQPVEALGLSPLLAREVSTLLSRKLKATS